MSSLSAEAYAVIEGRHSDPFRYLGPHLEGDVPVVRVFLPDAERVAIVDEQGLESDLQAFMTWAYSRAVWRTARQKTLIGFRHGPKSLTGEEQEQPLVCHQDRAAGAIDP
jgi:1,4-alpha-glucan branching enzyme